MASIAQEISGILFNNYISLIVMAAVGYDYILTFSDEVEYIWNEPWTRVSTLFLLARYCGLLSVMGSDIVGSSFLPDPEKTYVLMLRFTLLNDMSERLTTFQTSCVIVYILENWPNMVFHTAADLAMILRVWALYSRSRFILVILLTFCAAETIGRLIGCIIVTSTLNELVQYYGPTLNMLVYINAALQMALGVLMCLFVVIQFVKEALQMYRVSNHFRLNHYMSLLIREGMIYFFVMLAYSLIGILMSTGTISLYGWEAMFGMMDGILPYALIPRFILNLRKLHACNVRAYGSEIDTAFGLITSSGNGAVGGGMVFADQVRQDEGAEEGEEQGNKIELEERDIRGAGGDSGACISKSAYDSEEIQLVEREVHGAGG